MKHLPPDRCEHRDLRRTGISDDHLILRCQCCGQQFQAYADGWGDRPQAVPKEPEQAALEV